MSMRENKFVKVLLCTGCLVLLPFTVSAENVSEDRPQHQFDSAATQTSQSRWTPMSLLEELVALLGGTVGVVLVPTVARMTAGRVRMIGAGALDDQDCFRHHRCSQ